MVRIRLGSAFFKDVLSSRKQSRQASLCAVISETADSSGAIYKDMCMLVEFQWVETELKPETCLWDQVSSFVQVSMRMKPWILLNSRGFAAD